MDRANGRGSGACGARSWRCRPSNGGPGFRSGVRSDHLIAWMAHSPVPLGEGHRGFLCLVVGLAAQSGGFLAGRLERKRHRAGDDPRFVES